MDQVLLTLNVPDLVLWSVLAAFAHILSSPHGPAVLPMETQQESKRIVQIECTAGYDVIDMKSNLSHTIRIEIDTVLLPAHAVHEKIFDMSPEVFHRAAQIMDGLLILQGMIVMDRHDDPTADVLIEPVRDAFLGNIHTGGDRVLGTLLGQA
jgi:hypothetical protein